MQTEMIRLDPENPGIEGIEKAAGLIKAGELVVFPTETVYGLGASAFDPGAVEKIYRAKGRPQDNPLIVHVSSLKMAAECTRQDLNRYSSILNVLWPGPVTLVFKKSEAIPARVTAGLDSVGLRFPSHPVAMRLIKAAGVPIAAPSANISGRPSPTSEEHVLEDMNGRVGGIILSGDTLFGLESTIVDLSRDKPTLLRPGPVDAERLGEFLPELEIPDFVWAREEYKGEALSPGMKYRHYSPEIPLILIEGSPGAVVSRAGILARRDKSVVLCSQELADYYPVHVKKVVLGSRNDLYAVASGLFKALRDRDNLNYTQIISEPFPETGIGLAIMNRLRKAAWRIDRV